MNTLTEHVKKVNETITGFYDEVRQAFSEKILPALKETYTNVERTIIALAEEAIKLIGEFAQRVAESMKAFEEDFAKIGATVSAQFKKIAATFDKYFDALRKEINDFYQIILDNLKTLPGLDEIKGKIKEVLKQKLLKILKNLVNFHNKFYIFHKEPKKFRKEC